MYQNCHIQNRIWGSFWAQMMCNPKGNHMVKYFWPWPTMGVTGVKKPFWGQFEAKWKSGHNSVKYCSISKKFTWITHSFKGFSKPLWKLSSVYFSICQLNKLFWGPKSKYKNASVGNLNKINIFFQIYIKFIWKNKKRWFMDTLDKRAHLFWANFSHFQKMRRFGYN